MSKFYGQAWTEDRTSTTAATRCGHSGINASAQSYDGSIITRLHYDRAGALIVDIEVSSDSAMHGETVYSGPLNQLADQLDAGAGWWCRAYDRNDKITQGSIRAMLKSGEALPLDQAKGDGVRAHGFGRVAHSEGIYGISGGVIKDRKTGRLYATAARDTSLFCWF